MFPQLLLRSELLLHQTLFALSAARLFLGHLRLCVFQQLVTQ